MKNRLTNMLLKNWIFSKRPDLSLAICIGIFSIFFYTLNLTPSISAGDNGELTTAMHFLGVAHAPGYPLHSLIGKIATFIPIHNVAWRANFFSAICGGLTLFFATLVYIRLLILVKVLKRYVFISAAVAALAFMLSETFWGQAIICEVYTMSSIFYPLLFLILLRWYEAVVGNKEKKYPYFGENYLLAFSFLFGVALCGHQTIILIEVFVGCFVLYGLLKHVILQRKLSTRQLYIGMGYLGFVCLVFLMAWIFYYLYIMRLKSNLYFEDHLNVKIGLGVFVSLNLVLFFYYFFFRFFASDLLNPHNSLQKLSFLLIKMFVFLYLGFAIYLYMIIRSHGNPPINWMGISEAESFWGKLSKFFNALHRKQFGNTGKIPFSLHNFVWQIKILIFNIHGSQFTISFFLLALGGLLKLYLRSTFWFWFLLIMVISYNLQLTLFLRFDFNDKDIFFVKVFYIFSYFTFSIFIAFGISWFLEALEKGISFFKKEKKIKG